MESAAMGEKKAKMVQIEAQIVELGRREEIAGRAIEQSRAVYHGLLGDVELGQTVGAKALLEARVGVGTAEEGLVGITAAKAELSRRLADIASRLKAGTEAGLVTSIEGAAGQAEALVRAIMAKTVEAQRLADELRSELAGICEWGRQYRDSAGGSPGRLGRLGSLIEDGEGLKVSRGGYVNPLLDALRFTHEARLAWGGLGQPAGDGSKDRLFGPERLPSAESTEDGGDAA